MSYHGPPDLTISQALHLMRKPDTRSERDKLRRKLRNAGALHGAGKGGSRCWTTIHHLARLRLIGFDPSAEAMVREAIADFGARMDALEERNVELGDNDKIIFEALASIAKKVGANDAFSGRTKTRRNG